MPEMGRFEKRLIQSSAWEWFGSRVLLPWAVSAAGLEAGGRLLELGSGGGASAERLLLRHPDLRVTATDLDPDMVARARRRLTGYGDRADVARADARALPHADGSFDFVLGIGVLHHVGKWEEALAEARRVLRDGGRLILADLLSSFFAPPPLRRLFPPERTYTLEELRVALSRVGFERCRLDPVLGLGYRAIVER